LRLYFFESPDIQGLFNRFADIKRDLTGDSKPEASIPFASCFH